MLPVLAALMGWLAYQAMKPREVQVDWQVSQDGKVEHAVQPLK